MDMNNSVCPQECKNARKSHAKDGTSYSSPNKIVERKHMCKYTVCWKTAMTESNICLTLLPPFPSSSCFVIDLLRESNSSGFIPRHAGINVTIVHWDWCPCWNDLSNANTTTSNWITLGSASLGTKDSSDTKSCFWHSASFVAKLLQGHARLHLGPVHLYPGHSVAACACTWAASAFAMPQAPFRPLDCFASHVFVDRPKLPQTARQPLVVDLLEAAIQE